MPICIFQLSKCLLSENSVVQSVSRNGVFCRSMLSPVGINAHQILIVSIGLKVCPSNLTSMFPGILQPGPLENFVEKGAWPVSRDPQIFGC